MNAPLCAMNMNGPLIDRLHYQECLILKVASAIGDIFDIQTLQKILPFKDAIKQERLLKYLDGLDKKDIIEIMEV